MGFTRGSDYSKERIFQDVMVDETLEKLLKEHCKCKPQDNNFWYIKNDINPSIQCRGCLSTIERLERGDYRVINV
jgi:hypothetical protein